MAKLQTRSLLNRVLYCTLFVFLMAATSQEQDCNVFRPMQYAYDHTAIENSNTDSGICNTMEVNGRSYFVCEEGGRVKDQYSGPQTLTLQDSSHYYNWTTNGGRMLFEFARPATLTSVIIHYYIDVLNNVARPKLKLVELDDSYNLSQLVDPLPTDRTPGTITFLDDGTLTPGLYNETVALNNGIPTSKVVLFVFDNKLFNFVMTEITFCTSEYVTYPATTSKPSSPSPTNKGTVATVTESSTQKEETTSASLLESQESTSGQNKLDVSLFSFFVSLSILLLLR